LYRVYGMALFKESLDQGVGPNSERSRPETGLIVMVCHEWDKAPTIRPDWFPMELFTVEDPSLPSEWEFATSWQFDRFKLPQPPVPPARWGYRELVRSDEHFVGLLERDPAALAVFRAEHDRRERESQPGQRDSDQQRGN
jgi:hypothetical protein